MDAERRVHNSTCDVIEFQHPVFRSSATPRLRVIISA
jgi:hypothetical protein